MLDAVDHRSVLGQGEEKPCNEAVPGPDGVLGGKTNYETFLVS